MKAAYNKTKVKNIKKSNVVYISSYKKRNIVKPYTKTDDDWYDLLRASDSDKKVSFKGSRVIGKLILELHKNNDRSIYKDNHWFSKITKVYSSKQNGRIRGQIDHIFNFHFYKRIIVAGILLKDVYEISFATNGYKILNFQDIQNEPKNREENNLETPTNKSLDKDKNVHISGQKCPPYIDNKEIKEEEPLGYSSSFISNNEKLKIKKTTEPELSSYADGFPAEPAQDEILSEPNQPKLLTASEEKAIHQERMERASENTVTSSFAEVMSKVLNQHEHPNIEEEISIMKPEEPALSDKETRKMLLSKAIFDAFGATANEIRDNCTFEELEPDKVGIKPGIGVSFNDIEKAKIRRCIKAVYGEEVTILAATLKPMITLVQTGNESGLAKSKALVTSSCNNLQWPNFKATVKDRKVREMLNNRLLKIIEIPGKVIVETHSFLLNEILSSGYAEELEDAVVKTGLTLEFHEKTVASGYVDLEKNPTILTKEKILKDREWKKNVPNLLDDLINELKKK